MKQLGGWVKMLFQAFFQTSQMKRVTGDRQSITGVEGAMARKRLSDLLREEAQKPTESQETEAQEPGVAAEAAPELTSEAKSGATTAAPEASLEASPALPEVAKAATSSPTPADLQGTIAQLQAALEAEQQKSQQQIQELQQEIAQLQDKLQVQIELNQTPKEGAKSAPVQQLKAELEEARSVILQLSEENQKLQAAQKAQMTKAMPPAASQAQAAPVASKPQATQILTRSPAPARAALTPLPQPKSPEPGLESYKPAASQGIVPMPGRDRPNHEVALRKMMEHPALPGTLPEMSSEKSTSKISEVDIGWMD